jgi:predicted transcriptional regulator
MKQLPAETEEVVELTPEQEGALEESIAQIARGEFVTAKELFDELRAIRERYEQGRHRSRRHL